MEHDTDAHQGAHVSPHPFTKEHVAMWVGQLGLGLSRPSPFHLLSGPNN